MKRKAALAILLAALGVAVPAQPVAAAGLGQLIAPASTCPGQSDPGAPLAVQERTMRCLTNFARSGRGLAEMAESAALGRAARHKSADILRCDSFSHQACGREFTYWMERFGDCASAAESIAWGTGSLGSVHAIFRAWMHSAGHRENILGPYEEIGVGLRVGKLDGHSGAHVWTQDFGSRC